MAVACNDCNQSLKRAGEKRRKEKMIPYMKQYEKNLNCIGSQCKQICSAYAKLREYYCRENKLILQSFGMTGASSGLAYRIQYDVMRAEFIPSRKYSYNEEDIEILEYWNIILGSLS